MRTIKFRGKRLDNGEWVYGGFHEHTKRQICPIGDELTNKDICSLIIQSGFADWDMPKPLQAVEVIPESVGQWTGLVDRHGKEIFEGDIVGFEDATQTEGGAYEQNCIGAVEWGEETASFEVTNRLSAESWEVLCECAVIGNLMDSPELMEVE